eukprot:5026142-Amphidinium_carterae.1
MGQTFLWNFGEAGAPEHISRFDRGMTLVALRNNVLLWREFASMRKKVIDAQRTATKQQTSDCRLDL